MTSAYILHSENLSFIYTCMYLFCRLASSIIPNNWESECGLGSGGQEEDDTSMCWAVLKCIVT